MTNATVESATKLTDEFDKWQAELTSLLSDLAHKDGADGARAEGLGQFLPTLRAAIAALQAEPPPEHCVDVHALLREAADQKAARTEQLPTEQDCIRMMVQCRLRLLELGWTSGEYAPKDGKEFEGINPGFAGPATYTHLGSGFFIASPGDWWPAPRPLVFRLPATPPKD